MEHDGLGVGVLEQVVDLLGPVPEVGVDRRHARLERRQIGLEVLGRVEEIGRHLGLMCQAGGEQVGCQAVGPAVEVGPCQAVLTLHLTLSVGDAARDGLVHIGVVPVGHRHKH